MEPNDRTPLDSLYEGSWVMLNERDRDRDRVLDSESHENDGQEVEFRSAVTESTSSVSSNRDVNGNVNRGFGAEFDREDINTLGVGLFNGNQNKMSFGLGLTGAYGFNIDEENAVKDYINKNSGENVPEYNRTFSFKSDNSDKISGLSNHGARMQEAERNINFNVFNLQNPMQLNLPNKEPSMSRNIPTPSPSVSSQSHDELSDEIFANELTRVLQSTSSNFNNVDTVSVKKYGGRTPPILGASPINTNIINTIDGLSLQFCSIDESAPEVDMETFERLKEKQMHKKREKDLKLKSKAKLKKNPSLSSTRKIVRAKSAKSSSTSNSNDKLARCSNNREENVNEMDQELYLFGVVPIGWMLGGEQWRKFVECARECPIPFAVSTCLAIMVGLYIGKTKGHHIHFHHSTSSSRHR